MRDIGMDDFGLTGVQCGFWGSEEFLAARAQTVRNEGVSVADLVGLDTGEEKATRIAEIWTAQIERAMQDPRTSTSWAGEGRNDG